MTKSQKLLLLASLATVALTVIPYAHYALLPVAYLNTHFHELAHAVAAVVTGGMPQEIKVFADGSGVTPVAGGNILLVASAGYPGTAILGSLLILAGRRPDWAAKAVKALAVSLAVSLVLLVRGDWVGIFSAMFWIPVLWLAATKLKGDNITFFVQWLGLQMSLTAFQALVAVAGMSFQTDAATDATILAEQFGLPAPFWAAIWVVVSVVFAGSALRKAWHHRSSTGSKSP